MFRLVGVERERLAVGIDGDDPLGHPDELARPDSRSGRKLEDAAARRKRLERGVHLGDVLPPALLPLRLELVATAAVPPVVVLRRPRRVVLLLLLHKILHTATSSATNASIPARVAEKRTARGSDRRSFTTQPGRSRGRRARRPLRQRRPRRASGCPTRAASAQRATP